MKLHDFVWTNTGKICDISFLLGLVGLITSGLRRSRATRSIGVPGLQYTPEFHQPETLLGGIEQVKFCIHHCSSKTASSGKYILA